MKKLLLSIFTISTLATLAQTAQLSIRLVAPNTGTTITHNQSTTFQAYIRNTSTSSSIAADDTIALRIGALGQGNTFVPISNVFNIVSHGVIAAGDSILVSQNYTIALPSGTTNGVICIGVYNINNDSTFFFGASCRQYSLFNTVAELEKLAQSIKAYPNPASTIFTVSVKSTGASVDIMDITGRLVESSAVSMDEATFDVSTYKSGVYFYQVKNGEGKIAKSGKFTVAH